MLNVEVLGVHAYVKPCIEMKVIDVYVYINCESLECQLAISSAPRR